MQSVSYYVPNISCKHCTQRIISHLTELPGVLDVDANVESKEVFVDFEAPATSDSIAAALTAINYPPEL